MEFSRIGFLLNYTTLAAAAVALIADAVFLFASRKKITKPVKALLAVLLVILIIYFVFVLWVIFASGNAQPIADPIPLQ
jgi:hypothetical protein